MITSCPKCGGECIERTRPHLFTYRNVQQFVPDVHGTRCVKCHELYLGTAEADRVSKAMVAHTIDVDLNWPLVYEEDYEQARETIYRLSRDPYPDAGTTELARIEALERHCREYVERLKEPGVTPRHLPPA